MNKLLDRNQKMNDRRSFEISSRLTGRRRHLTTPNRLPESTIPEEHEVENLLSTNEQNYYKEESKEDSQTRSTVCCCCKIVACSAHFHRLPDLIVQHQPIIMSADVHFEQQSLSQMPIDNLSPKMSLVYTPHWIENDVFLPAGSQSFSQFTQLNSQQNNQANQEQSQLNKLDTCSPIRIPRCPLSSSALYQCNQQRFKARLMAVKARRPASVSFPIDHETLRQVGYSLRMISEQFHLQRLKANSSIAKNQQNNVTTVLKWFCKLVVNKLPSISWSSNKSNSSKDKKPVELSNKLSPISKPINRPNNLVRDQPDVVPHLLPSVIPRQRCHSTTTDC